MKKTLWIVILALICISCLISTVAFAAVEEVEEYPGTQHNYYLQMDNVYSQREWKFAETGSNAAGTYKLEGEDVIIQPTRGKGKMADTEEGFCFYYTTIDAEKENFYLKATFTVYEVYQADNQNGFGLICTDTIGTKNTGRYMNYAAACCSKVGSSAYNVPGGRCVWGYISPDGTSPSEDAAGNGESLRQSSWSTFKLASEEEPQPATVVGRDYTFVLRKSNTGYHVMLTACWQGTGTGETIYYGPAKLMSQDPEHVYVGFFATRNVAARVSDVFMAVYDSATDERAYQEPPKLQPLVLSIYSAPSRGQKEYVYKMRPSTSGTLDVVASVSSLKETVISGVHVEANELFVQEITLPDRDYVLLTTRFNPDSSYISGGSINTAVYYYDLPHQNGVVYASPLVDEGKGTGTKEDPVSLYDAVRFVLPGYTIIIPDGTYDMPRLVRIERGVNGTEQSPIVMRPETPGGVTFDFKNTAGTNEMFFVGGDYWKISGFEIINAPNSAKGMRIAGSYNLIEDCVAHHNTNSGIQISGNSKESYVCWPAHNLVKNCTSYNNCDETRQDADGFGVKLTVGDGNKLYGCVAYNNVDDGFDLYAKAVTGSIGVVVIENCIAFNNGYLPGDNMYDPVVTGEGNGFKLGGESLPGRHQLINCLAFGNGAKGITSNSGPDVIIKNCTSVDNNVFARYQDCNNENISLYAKRPNQITNFEMEGTISFYTSAANNIQDKHALVGQDPIASEGNFFWNGSQSVNASGAAVSADWFTSTDVSKINIIRGKGGSLQLNGLFELTDKAPANVGARFYYNEQLDEAMYQLKVAQTLEQKYAALRAIDSQLDSMTEQEKAHLELSQYNKAIEEYNAYLGDYGELTQTYQNMFGVIIAVAAVAVALGAAVITKFALRG